MSNTNPTQHQSSDVDDMNTENSNETQSVSTNDPTSQIDVGHSSSMENSMQNDPIQDPSNSNQAMNRQGTDNNPLQQVNLFL